LGRVINALMQKLLPAAKKSVLIKFRKNNGAWKEFLLPPKKNKFKVRGYKGTYYVKGTPDVEDSTNQRTYTFFSGIFYPISINRQHPELLSIYRESGESQDLEMEMHEQYAFLKAGLIKGKKDNQMLLMLIVIGVGINVLATIAFGFMMMQASGISFI